MSFVLFGKMAFRFGHFIQEAWASTRPILSTLLLVSLLANTSLAAPPGHVGVSYELEGLSSFDFKDGVGIADPADQNSPCTTLLLGLRGIQPPTETWEADQNMGTNLNGPAIGVSNLRPPLSPAGGWLPNSGGVNLGVPCPLPGAGTGSLWLVWSGSNWHSAESDSSAQLSLCTQETFASSSPGCLAVPDANMKLYASACNRATVTFAHDYTDSKGKYLAGLPFDTLGLKNDAIRCTVRHSHDYTDTIQDLTAGSASQTFDIIKNEAVVHAGSGTTYMAVCWQVTYLDFQNPLNPTTNIALAHDWKLILDVNDAAPGSYVPALQLHYGGQQPGDVGAGTGGATVAMRGFYSQSPTGAGQNGFGPCSPGSAPEGKKCVAENPYPCPVTGPEPPICSLSVEYDHGVFADRPVAICFNTYSKFACTPDSGNPNPDAPAPANQGEYKWDCMRTRACDGHEVETYADLFFGGEAAYFKSELQCNSPTIDVEVASSRDDGWLEPGPNFDGTGEMHTGRKPWRGDYHCLLSMYVTTANPGGLPFATFSGEAWCRDTGR